MNNNIDISNLVCLLCGSPLLKLKDNDIFCSQKSCRKYEVPYFSVNDKPVLIDFDKSILKKESFVSLQGKSPVNRSRSFFFKKIKNLFTKKNIIVNNNVNFIVSQLIKIDNPQILIVGGGEIGNGLNNFYEQFKNNITAFDIYDSEYVNFIADAHQIPIKNGSFDLVIIQAVLEHVLSPEIVVNEIWRVLKNDALVYAETPFMQQVHEGKFDFLRFTESGHRYLFKKFSHVKSGYILGVGTSLLWSLDYFFSGLFRSRVIGKMVKLFFFWLTYFDNFIPFSFNIDGASGLFFIGRKSDKTINAQQILNYYQGNQ
jgi:SAM-dependent methyltransferase